MSTSPLLDYRRLFELSDPFAKRPLRLSPVEQWVDSHTRSLLLRGKWKPHKPILLRAEMGGRATDFLWTTTVTLVCISQRVVKLLEEHEFTGWITYPVEVYDRKGERLMNYFGFAITGRGGKRDRSRSQIITKPAPAPRGKSYQVYKGLYFDESQWDGSDIFLVDGIKVVTQPVRDAFKQAKITNVRFAPLTEVEIDVYLNKFS